MIESVQELCLEFDPHSFCDGDVLRHRHIDEGLTRTIQDDLFSEVPWSCGRSEVCGIRSTLTPKSDKVLRIENLYEVHEATVCRLINPVDTDSILKLRPGHAIQHHTGIADLINCPVTAGQPERIASLNGNDARQRPAADDFIHHATPVSEHSALTERQVVHRAKVENMSAVKSGGQIALA